MQRSHLAVLAALTLLLVAAPVAGAQPPALNITLSQPPNSGVDLGKATGDKTCTGEGDATVCVTPIGTNTTLKDTVPVTDNATQAQGLLTVVCSIMLSGTTTAYQTTTGTTDATGSQDCVLQMVFPGGDAVFGSMHQTRVVAGTTQTSTFEFVFTGGTGRYDGFAGTFTSQEKSPWTPPGPLSEKEGKRLVSARATAGVDALVRAVRGKGKNQAIIRPKSKPITNFATVGLLVPTNKAVIIKAATTPGASCQGTITGGATVALATTKANAKGTATFKRIASGAFAGAPTGTWKATVTCKGAKGSSTGTATLKAYEVLK